ncbi:MAG: hypothetical protein ACP5KS_03015 [Candidatus Hydrogenedens sp.]
MPKKKITKKLKIKELKDDKIFFDIAELLYQQKALRKSIYLLKSDNSDKDPLEDPSTYVALTFEIEGVGKKMILMPLFKIYNSTIPGAEKVREVLKNIPKSHIV